MANTEIFNELIDLLAQYKSAQAGAAFGTTAAERERAKNDLAKIKGRSDAILDAMSLDEMKEYAEYFKAWKASTMA